MAVHAVSDEGGQGEEWHRCGGWCGGLSVKWAFEGGKVGTD